MRHMDGLSVRIHQEGYIVGATNPRAGFDWEPEHEVFENKLWPQLAEQCGAFEAVKLKSGWLGHYDMNRLDGTRSSTASTRCRTSSWRLDSPGMA